jgi:hypothetical protein
VVAPPACEPGQDTPMIFPRLDRLARGQPQLLAVRSPRATGLASTLSGCILVTGQRCLFRHRRHCGRLTGPAETRVLRGTTALVVPPFGVFRWAALRSPETSARVIRPCWCAVTTVCPLGQLRFAQARNLPELLYSTHRGFSSRLAARFLSRLWHVRPCQKNR